MQNIKINFNSGQNIEIFVPKKYQRNVFLNKIALKYEEETVFEFINFYINILVILKAIKK